MARGWHSSWHTARRGGSHGNGSSGHLRHRDRRGDGDGHVSHGAGPRDLAVPTGATATTLNGEPIEVVDTDLIRTPRPGDPTGAAAGASAGPGASPAPGAGGIPPEVVDGGGSAPAVPAPAGTPAVPDWGTQLAPQQMIDCGDPALIVLGQEIRRRMAEQGIVDPSGVA